MNDVISDHHPIYICIKKRRNSVEYSKIKGRTYKKYDKLIIQTLIKNENWEIFYELDDPTELWNLIKDRILKHLDIMCPIKYINSPPWITHDIVEAINDRNQCYNLARHDNSDFNVRNARMQRNRVNKLINSTKSTYIKDTLEANKDNPKKFWRILNSTLLKGDKNQTYVSLSKGNDTYTDIEESCECMNDYLADIVLNLCNEFNRNTNDVPYENMYNLICSNEEIFLLLMT